MYNEKWFLNIMVLYATICVVFDFFDYISSSLGWQKKT